MTHADHLSFNIQCSLQGGKRAFRTLSTYLGHVYSHHDCGILDATEPDNAPQDGIFVCTVTSDSSIQNAIIMHIHGTLFV